MLKFLKTEKSIMLFCVLLILTVYHLVFFNRFFPIQEGWFSVFAHEILNGKMPYKDFHLFLQPLYPLEITSLVYFFGNNFIILRIFGLIERLLITTVLYLIFLKFFSVRNTVLITLTTIAVYMSNTTDVIYSYYQSCLLLGIISVYFILNYFSKLEEKNSFVWIIISGIFGSLSFLTKQSTGLFLSFVPLTVIVISLFRSHKKKAFSSVVFYCIGYSLPLFVIFYWLYYNDVFFDYLHQVYSGGASSKGSIFHALFGFYKRAFRPLYLIAFSFLLFVSLFWIRLWKKAKSIKIYNTKENQDPLIFVFIAVASLFSFLIPYFNHPLFNRLYQLLHFYNLKLLLVHIIFYFSIIVTMFYFIKALKKKFNLKNAQFFLLSSTALSVMYAHGLSFTIEEHSVAPSLGLIFGISLTSRIPIDKIKNMIIYFICFLIISLCAGQKYVWPYEWWGWREPDIHAANQLPTLEYLRGFRLSHMTNEVLTDVTSIILNHSSEKDNIYTFPHIPIFYILSNRYPNTFALVHYFDVCPDVYASNDADKLLKSPPKVIVYLEFPETVWKFHEEAFRKGNLSGQRKILSAVNLRRQESAVSE